MKATAKQKQIIQLKTPDKLQKVKLVQWATNDQTKTSCNDLSFNEANKILIHLGQHPHLPDNWAVFDNANSKHRMIMSLMRQAQWTKPHDKHGEVADMERLSNFLQSPKSPVLKPLQDMEPEELEKIIKALQGIVRFKWKRQ